MKEVVRKLTAAEERKITVKSKWTGVLLLLPST